jgi:hypothetical protein
MTRPAFIAINDARALTPFFFGARVYISNFRAILNQREAASFTKKDLILRDKVFDFYSHSRPTPFPWLFDVEPKFEVEG